MVKVKGRITDAYGKYWKTLSFKSDKEAIGFKRHFKRVAPKIKIEIIKRR